MSEVDALSISMEGGGFGFNKTRMFVRRLIFRGTDVAVTILSVSITVLISFWTILVSIPMEFHL